MEIRREKIDVMGMTPKEIVAKYNIPEGTAYAASKRGFFVRNCRRKEVIIDESVFDTNGAYGIAWRVYNTNFRKYPKLYYMREDLVQEAVTRMYELSGRAKELAEKDKHHNISWHYFYIAQRAMRNYLKADQKTENICHKVMDRFDASYLNMC